MLCLFQNLYFNNVKLRQKFNKNYDYDQNLMKKSKSDNDFVAFEWDDKKKKKRRENEKNMKNT